MKIDSERLDTICEKLLIKYSSHLKEAIENKDESIIPFWEGKYDAIYELLMIIDSPLWYKLHSDDDIIEMINKEKIE